MCNLFSEKIETDVRWLLAHGYQYDCTSVRGYLARYTEALAPACATHDYLYQTGGGAFERFYADVIFWAKCVKKAESLEGFNKYIYSFIALCWFLAVRTFGWMFFSYGGPRGLDIVLLRNRRLYGSGWRNVYSIRMLYAIYLKLYRKWYSLLKRNS